VKKRTLEGYVCIIPYGGDDFIVCPEKIDLGGLENLDRVLRHRTTERSLLDILDKLVGKRVRVEVEEKKITIEILD